MDFDAIYQTANPVENTPEIVVTSENADAIAMQQQFDSYNLDSHQ